MIWSRSQIIADHNIPCREHRITLTVDKSGSMTQQVFDRNLIIPFIADGTGISRIVQDSGRPENLVSKFQLLFFLQLHNPHSRDQFGYRCHTENM